jgi:NAD(P)-dependent dehydrogenase (short-subunit alcohol dehydrogenase family)
MTHLKPLAEQVVVLMGASSGIGREAAVRFARRGARVVVAARGEEGLVSLAEEIRAEGGTVTPAVADTAAFAQVQGVAESAVAAYGRLDTWVHLAGVGLWSPFTAMTPDEWRRVLDVNLNGQAYGAMAALPHLMREGRGALIHVSSVEARVAMPYQSAYAAAKHGMHGFLKALRLELQHAGAPISVTEVMPYGTNTPLFDQSLSRLGVKPRPLSPIYEPVVVADAILYAAEHPVREIVPSGVGKLAVVAQGLAPRLVDAYLMRAAFRGQRTTEPRAPSDPNNLQQPLHGADSAVGSFARARSSSLYGWLETHPAAKQGLVIGLLSAVAWLWSRDRAKS